MGGGDDALGEWGYTYYEDDLDSLDHTYTVPAVLMELARLGVKKRLFDLGCGNGAVANKLHHAGYTVTGVDLSPTGIESARTHYPHLRLEVGSAYEDLAARHGQFPAVICLEVIEHLFYPRKMAKTLYDLTKPGGYAIVSTPYHGYLKNVLIAASGKFDRHVDPLWDYGHIKFFSMSSLRELLSAVGFTDIRYRRLGRVPVLAKSMIAVARRP